jgi:hypothetical protein
LTFNKVGDLIEIDGHRLNFDLMRVDDQTYKLLVCTYDAGDNNSCIVYGLDVSVVEKSISVSEAADFDLAEGMCAHKVVLSPEFYVLSCAKIFQNSYVRKVLVLSATATEDGDEPLVVLENYIPYSEEVMSSPEDSLSLLWHSRHESELIYAIGSTVITVSLLVNYNEM